MEHKEELDSDTYRIIQASTDFEKFRQNDLKLYLSALSPADVADFYWGIRQFVTRIPLSPPTTTLPREKAGRECSTVS